jgi:crossover junction endodeoxyribonuclease RusA
MLALTLPFPPTINHYYGVRGKARFIKPAGREFRKLVADEVAVAGQDTFEGAVQLVIRVFPPDRRKRDLDNLLKALQDALTHAGVWLDDSQIEDLHITKGEVRKGGETRVVINSLDRANG